MKPHIKKHFQSADPKLFALVDLVGVIEFEKSTDYFARLCEDIIGQQLSGKAADSIHKRFVALFPGNHVTAEKLLVLPDDQIRNIGTSWAKVRSLKDLAQKVLNKTVRLDLLDSFEDAKVIEHLRQVKGIGPWTAEMFLMFTLGREDVFSFGDLGLKKGIMKVYNLKKEPTQKQLQKITKKWSPYRSYAARLLWKSLEI